MLLWQWRKKTTQVWEWTQQRERWVFSHWLFFVSFESCASEIPPHKRKGNMFIRGKSLYKMLLFGKWNLTFLNQNAMCLFTFFVYIYLKVVLKADIYSAGIHIQHIQWYLFPWHTSERWTKQLSVVVIVSNLDTAQITLISSYSVLGSYLISFEWFTVQKYLSYTGPQCNPSVHKQHLPFEATIHLYQASCVWLCFTNRVLKSRFVGLQSAKNKKMRI